MKSGEITDKKSWNAFILENGPRSGAFLHAWEWGEFQKALGQNIHREGFYENERLEMAALMIEKDLPLGMRYLTCPRGPVVHTGSNPAELMSIIRKAGAEAGALFLRFEPPIEGETQIEESPRLKKSIEIHPAHTLLLDLTEDEETLLASMHQKTRYNIRLAQRKEVSIEFAPPAFMEQVWPIFERTAKRGKFHLHPKTYYEKMLSVLDSEPCRAFLAVALQEGNIIAANIMIDFAGVRTYLHGASDHAYRSFMGPYLLHWTLIQDAREKGLRYYDWWGVAPEDSQDHPWTGITRFKEGFGGERVVYPGTYDLILRPASYTLYKTARNIFRKMR